jgi:HTH-type transcriptional regulator, cell division transcriptional repressor
MGSEEFGRELAAARRERKLSQRALAELIGVRQTAVAQWERGSTTPRNQHVFAVERILRLSPGALARYLGFGPPVDAPAVPLRPLTVLDAIESDTRLDDQQRQLLSGVYRQFIRRPRHRSAR